MTISRGPLHGSARGVLVVVALLVAACGSGQGVATSTPVALSPAATTSLAPATPSSNVAAATAELPPLLPVGDLEAGLTYRLAVAGPHRLVVTVPAEGWFSIDTWFLGKDEVGDEGYDITLLPYQVANVYADPCHWKGNGLVPAVGPSVDDLAAALVEQAGPAAVAPTDVTLDGYAGKQVELTIPDDIDTGSCDEGDYGRWSPTGDPGFYGPFTYGKGQRDTVNIVDVDGARWVIDANYTPGNSAASLAELEQLVASVRFEP
jgi:hypothetical protein